MKKYLLSSVLCMMALSTGCEKSSSSENAVSQVARKPSVAIVPLIDNSEQNVGWSLSDEFTYTLCSKLMQKGQLDLALPDRLRTQMKKVKGQNNPFGEDLLWIKSAFSKEDFVVFLELVEHSETPTETTKTAAPETLSAQLNICVRLRILDLRGNEPKVTLQELFQDSHFIPRQFTKHNFDQVGWNTEEFALTPMGIAHSQLIKELKTRIEDYIMLATKRSL